MEGKLPPPSSIDHVTTLVLGGARSGKSAFAERRARQSGLEKLYLATAEPFDAEMRARIARHQQDRAGQGWRTREVPLALPEALLGEAAPGRIIVVDCLTLWLTNVMVAGRPVEAAQTELLAALFGVAGPVILVSNEVGLGLVPETPLGRAFRDHQGRLNQAIAAHVPRVAFLAAGLPLWLKGGPG